VCVGNSFGGIDVIFVLVGYDAVVGARRYQTEDIDIPLEQFRGLILWKMKVRGRTRSCNSFNNGQSIKRR